MTLLNRLAATAFVAAAIIAPAQAASPAEDLVTKVSSEVIETLKSDKDIQAGDVSKVTALVDAKVMPYVDFSRMTGIAVGLPWRNATPEQRQRLMAEFKTTLIRTYAGALTQVKDQAIVVKGSRPMPNKRDVEVLSEVRGNGDKVELNYRMSPEEGSSNWRIFDVNILGVWMADTSFKSQWAPIVSKGGLDGLIQHLAQRNQSLAGAAK